MSDLFHEEVPFSFIDQVIKTITATPQHRYQLLTKRSAQMAEYNVWVGTTVEAQAVKNRIDTLRKIAALIRFLSCEPLIEEGN
jgi:protein gp37